MCLDVDTPDDELDIVVKKRGPLSLAEALKNIREIFVCEYNRLNVLSPQHSYSAILTINVLKL